MFLTQKAKRSAIWAGVLAITARCEDPNLPSLRSKTDREPSAHPPEPAGGALRIASLAAPWSGSSQRCDAAATQRLCSAWAHGGTDPEEPLSLPPPCFQKKGSSFVTWALGAPSLHACDTLNAESVAFLLLAHLLGSLGVDGCVSPPVLFLLKPEIFFDQFV